MQNTYKFLIALTIAATVVFAVLIVGKNAATAPEQNDRSLAESLLGRTIGAYSSYTRGAFYDELSENFVPNRDIFINNLEQHVYQENILDINYFINTVNRNNDKLAVSFRWEKKITLFGSGATTLSRGNADFVYIREPGRWRLYQVKGQSPF